MTPEQMTDEQYLALLERHRDVGSNVSVERLILIRLLRIGLEIRDELRKRGKEGK